MRPAGWSVDRLIATRMANQGLVDRGDVDAQAVAGRTVGLQAQDSSAAHLAVRSRSARADRAGSVAETGAPARVVRTWLMRGTLHAVAIDDVRWLRALYEPALLTRCRTHRVQHGLTDKLLARAATGLPAILAHGRAVTRRQLVSDLADVGVSIRTPGQATAHFTVWASTVGLLCRGPDAGRDPTYVWFEDWVPPAPTLDQPAGYRELATVEIDGRTMLHLGDTEPAHRSLRLLAGWDTYLMGYRRRHDFLAENKNATEVIVGGGWLHPSVVLDGRIIGTWRLAPAADRVLVRVGLVDPPGRSVRTQLEREAAHVGRFYGRPAALELVDRFDRAART